METPQPIPNVKALRKCLRCQKQFKSEWVGNRICPVCSKIPNTETKYHEIVTKYVDQHKKTTDDYQNF